MQTNIRENQRGNQYWTILQRHWQHWVHNTQDGDKQNKIPKIFDTEQIVVINHLVSFTHEQFQYHYGNLLILDDFQFLNSPAMTMINKIQGN